MIKSKKFSKGLRPYNFRGDGVFLCKSCTCAHRIGVPVGAADIGQRGAGVKGEVGRVYFCSFVRGWYNKHKCVGQGVHKIARWSEMGV